MSCQTAAPHSGVCLTAAYLPPVEYVSQLLLHPHAYIEQHDNYCKQTYRNRCNIATAGGVVSLSIPVEKASTPKVLMRDVRLSEHGNWRHVHRTAIESAYGSSPFFEFYKDDLLPFYTDRKHRFLLDFNLDLLHLICQWLELDACIELTQDYLPEQPTGILDLRDAITPKQTKSSATIFTPIPYYQPFIHKQPFLPNMSAIDLIFNMGPESILVLDACVAAGTGH